MPHKYPYLRSSVTPFGLMEQLGIAFTMDPVEEGTPPGQRNSSWFGRLLSDNNFTFDYINSTAPRESFNKTQMVTHYFTKHFDYAAYDWECLALRITRQAGGAEVGVIEGEVDIKVRHCNVCAGANAHDGEFDFIYEIERPNANSSWKVKKWTLTRKTGAAPPSPKITFV